LFLRPTSRTKRLTIRISGVACAQLQAFQAELSIGCGMAVVPRLLAE